MGDEDDLKRLAKNMRALVSRYRITDGNTFDLEAHTSDDLPKDFPDKHAAAALLQAGIERMAELQELLYANATWSLLVVFQAMDAAGKDSTIKHVMSGVNPQGVAVTSFKAPGPEERSHDFLWRISRALPARGMIGIFNRSHYEEVLVARVHRDLIAGAKLPSELAAANGFWRERIADIAAWEAYLTRQGTRILKIFLDVGRDEQRKRLLARLDDPAKTWKFDPSDLREREAWAAYREAYQAAIAGTASLAAPWLVVPADRKWFARLVVAEAIIATLEDLDLAAPKVPDDVKDKLAAARRRLEHD